MEVKFVFLKGDIIPAEVVSISPEDMIRCFQSTVGDLAAISLEGCLLNAISAPIMIANTFKDILSIGLESGYQFKELQTALESK